MGKTYYTSTPLAKVELPAPFYFGTAGLRLLPRGAVAHRPLQIANNRSSHNQGSSFLVRAGARLTVLPQPYGVAPHARL